jgi:FKBP-type peptidyl-prolyl cis-trans isomerase
MKKRTFFAACVVWLAASSFLFSQGINEGFSPGETETEEVSEYTPAQIFEAWGWFVAHQNGIAEMLGGLDVTEDEMISIGKGMLAAARGGDNPDAEGKIGPAAQAYLNERSKIVTDALVQEGKDEEAQFFADLIGTEGVLQLPSGLAYEILEEGSGAYPKATDKVKVHYEGSLLNGKVFDSSLQKGAPAEFGLNQVIPGWSEGVQRVAVGGKIRLYVPSSLGYGDQGSPPHIPPASALIFIVDLLDIITPPPVEAMEPSLEEIPARPSIKQVPVTP